MSINIEEPNTTSLNIIIDFYKLLSMNFIPKKKYYKYWAA